MPWETAALIPQDQTFKALNNRVDQGVQHLDDAVGQLEKQVDSLAEMVFRKLSGMRFMLSDVKSADLMSTIRELSQKH